MRTGRHAVTMVALDFSLWRGQFSDTDITILGVCCKHKHSTCYYSHTHTHTQYNAHMCINYMHLCRKNDQHRRIDTQKLLMNVGKILIHVRIPKVKNLDRNCGRACIEVSRTLTFF